MSMSATVVEGHPWISVPDNLCFFAFFVGEDNGEPGCGAIASSQHVTHNESEKNRVPHPFSIGQSVPVVRNGGTRRRNRSCNKNRRDEERFTCARQKQHGRPPYLSAYSSAVCPSFSVPAAAGVGHCCGRTRFRSPKLGTARPSVPRPNRACTGARHADHASEPIETRRNARKQRKKKKDPYLDFDVAFRAAARRVPVPIPMHMLR